jgi:hypothetical protein
MCLPQLLGVVLAVSGISGCATMSVEDPAYYSSDRAVDYPVQIVAARFVPEADVDAANAEHALLPRGYLPVAVEAEVSTSTA